MKECDKQKSNINNKLRVIYMSSNNIRHPVTKTFTTLHYTSLNFTQLHFTALVDTSSSRLNFTQLHFTTPSIGLALIVLMWRIG